MVTNNYRPLDCHVKPQEASARPARGVPRESGGYSEMRWYALQVWETLRVGELWRGVFAGKLLFRALSVVRGTLIYVIVQNLNEIGQSPAELQRFNLLDLAAVRHLGYSKEGIRGPFHTFRTTFCTHTPNLVKIIRSAVEIFAQNKIRKNAPGDGILFPVLTLTPYILRRPSSVSSCKISAKSDNRRPSCSYFTILQFGAHLGFPLRQRISELWGPTKPVGTARKAHHRSLTSSF